MEKEERLQKTREKITTLQAKSNKLKQGQIREKYNKDAKFVKLFSQGMGILDLLRENDLKLLIYLTQFAIHETNELKYENGAQITRSNLIKQIGWSKTKVYGSIKNLKDAGFLNQDENKIWYINPAFCANGVKIQNKTVNLFQ